MTVQNRLVKVLVVFVAATAESGYTTGQDAPQSVAATAPLVEQPAAAQPVPRRCGELRLPASRARKARPKSSPSATAEPQRMPTAEDTVDSKDSRVAPPSSLPSLLLAPPPNSAGTPAPYATKLNLNRATIEEIQRLPNMTPGVAARILAGRPYRRIGELGRIGIPPEIIESIAPAVSLDP